MTSFTDKVFTDVVKDVIGNDPVLDQFDISYAASFYGTMQDDYVTGTMVSIIPSVISKKTRLLVTGTRGKYFSKFYSDSAVPLSEGLLSPEAYANPYLSFRLVRPNEKTGRSYRFVSHYDSDERYYDTCLPNFAECLAANDASTWVYTNFGLSTVFWVSPYLNVISAIDSGIVSFNSPYKYDKNITLRDTLSDNDWTWSFPYENKYKPDVRLVSPEQKLGINTTNWGYDLSVSGTPFRLDVPKKFKGLLPLLPGKSPSKLRFKGYYPGLRLPTVFTGSSLTAPIYSLQTLPVVPGSDRRLDDVYGVDYILPTDVYFNLQQDSSWLTFYKSVTPPPASEVTVPDPAPVTGSMTYNDTVKFLYGFGDLNNMVYGYKKIDVDAYSSTVVENFETYADNSAANAIPLKTISNIGGLSGPVFKINWAPSPAPGVAKGWTVQKRSGTSGATSYYGSTAEGIFWQTADGGENILCSDTDATLGGNMSDTAVFPLYDVSIVAIDITSSLPWSLRYKRAVASHTSDGLFTYFSAIPGTPVSRNPLLAYAAWLPIEFVRGKTTAGEGASGIPGSYSRGVMGQFDLMTTGSSDSYPQQFKFIDFFGYTSSSFEPYRVPLAAGEYRLCFAFLQSGSTPGNPDEQVASSNLAAIDNLEFKYWGMSTFTDATDLPKAGCNNYPEFRKAVGDPRHRPIPIPLNTYPFNEPSVISGSADAYASYVFGVSPVIRGWKYGLFSGFAQNTKAVFRRDRYGQLRDMLEQRQYSKFVSVQSSPTDNEAITSNNEVKEKGEKPGAVGAVGQISPSPVTVNFVRQRYTRDERGIGDIYNESVQPSLTYSQNLSYEVTSSVPYFDGVARHRSEEEIRNIKNTTL